MTASLQRQTDPRRITPLDVERVRADFPILRNVKVNGKPLVYLDNAASSQVPQVVIDRGATYLARGAFEYPSRRALSEHDAQPRAYEGAREKVKRFINAREAKECIFVRRRHRRHQSGDARLRPEIRSAKVTRVIISAMEHHANIVPWQMLCEEKGARLRVIPMNDAGELMTGRVRGPPERAHKDRRRHPHLKRARHDQPGQGNDRDRAQTWRTGVD